eukprot:GFYU01010541.1.p2 GENE.GFYU01010541.1~~GFYU01010541.1.p2  ORF type:complete len:110 (-),score=28.16 GFYU01010541.1:234-563(-)
MALKDDSCQTEAAAAIRNITRSQESAVTEFHQRGTTSSLASVMKRIGPIVTGVEDRHAEIRKHTVGALKNMARNINVHKELTELNAMELIQMKYDAYGLRSESSSSLLI